MNFLEYIELLIGGKFLDMYKVTQIGCFRYISGISRVVKNVERNPGLDFSENSIGCNKYNK